MYEFCPSRNEDNRRQRSVLIDIRCARYLGTIATEPPDKNSEFFGPKGVSPHWPASAKQAQVVAVSMCRCLIASPSRRWRTLWARRRMMLGRHRAWDVWAGLRTLSFPMRLRRRGALICLSNCYRFVPEPGRWLMRRMPSASLKEVHPACAPEAIPVHSATMCPNAA